ncbi:MAG TPA: tetratricopeptide repeat protein, partial [Steroidobacteraceae bacterium]|nr:tetratricopeptide repeat protein [Steroidobacteraceae bacterium]
LRGAPLPAAPAERAASASAPAPTANSIGNARLPQRRGRRALYGMLVLAALAIAGAGFWLTSPHRLALPSNRPDPAGPLESAVKERSIAVLPFADMSEKKDQGYFADGMAEEILGVLAKVPRLTVISRTSSFQFKGRDADIKTIGASLGAHYIVEGSVRKSGARMRINAELVDTGNGTERWSETYDRDAGDAFNVQDEIAASIVRALQLAVVGDEEIPARVKPRNPEAYELYLRGRQALDRFDREGFEQAADLYQRALDLDPQFVPAVNALADAQVFLTQWGYIPPKVGYERARRTAQLGEKLDPNLGEPHWLLATIDLQYDWDWDGARTELERADAISPRASHVFLTRGMLSFSLGRLNDAERQLSAAQRLDPLSPNTLFVLGWARFWSGDLPEAESLFRKALQISPTYESVHYYLGHVLMVRGDLTAALGEMKAEPDEESRLAGIASVEFAMGRRKESDSVLAKLTQLSADDWASGIASVHAIRNEPDAAFQWLDRAFAQKDEDLYIIKGDPLYKNVAHDPRYTAFLRKMNLPE